MPRRPSGSAVARDGDPKQALSPRRRQPSCRTALPRLASTARSQSCPEGWLPASDRALPGAIFLAAQVEMQIADRLQTPTIGVDPIVMQMVFLHEMARCQKEVHHVGPIFGRDLADVADVLLGHEDIVGLGPGCRNDQREGPVCFHDDEGHCDQVAGKRPNADRADKAQDILQAPWGPGWWQLQWCIGYRSMDGGGSQ